MALWQPVMPATNSNARATLSIQERYGSLEQFLWRYVEGEPIQNHWQSLEQVPVSTPLSDRISKDLKSHGFNFVGTTICYAFMQAVGLVNDHTTDCFRYDSLT